MESKEKDAESQTAKGCCGRKKTTAESQANKGRKKSTESKAAKGSCGGKKNHGVPSGQGFLRRQKEHHGVASGQALLKRQGKDHEVASR